MNDKKGPTTPKETAPPADLREEPDWHEAIGPEDEDDEVIDQNLSDYGFNQMDEDDFESDPVGPSDMPDWTENAVYGEDRPLMPDPEQDLPDSVHEIDEEAKRQS